MNHWIKILIDSFGTTIVLMLLISLCVLSIWGMLKLFNVFRAWGNKYQERKIKLLKERISLIKDCEDVENADNPYVKTIVVAFIVSLVLIIAAIIANKEWGLRISSDHVVLTFVGIIATFIVITNHVQTNELSKRVDRQLEKNKQDMKELREESTTAQETLSNRTGKLVSEAFSNNLDFINACQEKETLECARLIASAYVANNSNPFEVRLISGGTEYNESLLLIRREDRIFLQKSDNSKTLSIKSEEIKSINQKEFNHQYIETLVFNLILINERKNKQ